MRGPLWDTRAPVTPPRLIPVPSLPPFLIPLILLAACGPSTLPATSTPPAVPASATATVPFPTVPATATPPPAPTVSPTPDILAGLGDVLFFDDFSFNHGWPLGEAAVGGTSLLDGRLVIAVREPRQYRMAVRARPSLADFYAEAVVTSTLCSPGDEFGIVFRVNSLAEHYRYTISCEGTARVRRLLVDASRALVLPEASPAVFAGPLAVNRIAVRVSGDRFRFYVNGVEILQARDATLPSGRIGFYVRASRQGQSTIAFDDLLVRELAPLVFP